MKPADAPLGMIQPLGFRQERIRWAGSFAGFDVGSWLYQQFDDLRDVIYCCIGFQYGQYCDASVPEGGTGVIFPSGLSGSRHGVSGYMSGPPSRLSTSCTGELPIYLAQNLSCVVSAV